MMKNIILILFFISHIALLGQSSRSDSLRRVLFDGGVSEYVMIFAHRGDWRNAPENSLRAYQNCIDAGFDGIEVDVQMTKDSVLIMMHDDTLDRTTTGQGKMSDYTLSEIKELSLRSPIGVTTRQKVPTFAETLELCKGKILLQVDKWPSVYHKVIETAKDKNCLNQIILRSSNSSKVLKEKYGLFPKEIIFIPVVVCNGNNGDFERLDDFINNINTPVISLSFKKDDYPIINKAVELKDKGYRIWYNSLWSTFNGGHDDELAFIDPENAYGWLINKGANIIFTDHPFILKSYLEKNKKRNLP